VATLPYSNGEIGDDILTEQTIFAVPQIKLLVYVKINKNKGKKNKCFPAILPIIYIKTPCRNYSKLIRSHVKTTVPGIVKCHEHFGFSDVCMPVIYIISAVILAYE